MVGQFSVSSPVKFSKLGVEGNFLNLTEIIYKRLMANIILNGEKLDAFPLTSGTRKGCPLTTSLHHCTGSSH